MDYKIEDINECTKKFIFNFTDLNMDSEINEEVLKIQKSANLKGFRKGKAPLDLIKKTYNHKIQANAIDSYIRNRFLDAINKEKLKVVGYPKFENLKYEPNKLISFDALVEVFPVFSLKDISNISIKKKKAKVSKDEVDRLVKSYLESKSVMQEIKNENHTIVNGNFVVINYNGKRDDGKQLDGMSDNDSLLEVGSKRFIQGFEENLIGMKKGDKKSFDVKFPDDYFNNELKSRGATFEVEILEIKEKTYPKLTDSLATELDFKSKDDLLKESENRLLEQKNVEVENDLKQQLLDKIIADNNFSIPTTMVDKQKEYLKKDMENLLTRQGFNNDMIDDYFKKWGEDLDKKAENQVRVGLILNYISNKYDISVQEEDINKKLSSISKKSNLSLEKVREYYLEKPDIKRNFLASLKEEIIFNKMFEMVNIKEA